MIKVEFCQTGKDTKAYVGIQGDHIIFTNPKPVVIQPSEIIKISMGTAMKLPEGYIGIITTHPRLSGKACELFPSAVIRSARSPDAELELAIRNSGRNQVNLMQDEPIGVGYISQIQTIDARELDIEVLKKSELPSTSPQKKNPFNFEIK
jgi:hypothetical protein